MSLTAPAGNATFRRLGRETVIYGLGVILGRAVSFLMLPVYTRFLSPSDYGIIQLLDLTVDVAAIFFTAGATSGVQRFYFKTSDPAARARLLSTTFFLVLTLSTLGALTLAALVTVDLEVRPQGGGPAVVHHAGCRQFRGRHADDDAAQLCADHAARAALPGILAVEAGAAALAQHPVRGGAQARRGRACSSAP